MARAKLRPVETAVNLSEAAGRLAGDAPDASVPFEALRWRSDVFGGVMVDTSSIERRFIGSRLPDLTAGVRGRGKAELDDAGVLTIQFGLSADEVDSGLVAEYVRQLLDYLGLDERHVLDTRIAAVNLDPAFDAEIDEGLRRIGLRALHDWSN